MTKKLAAHPACTSPVSVAALVSILIRAPFFGCADGGSQTCFSFVLETERENGAKNKKKKKRKMGRLFHATFANLFLISVVQSPKVRMWTLK